MTTKTIRVCSGKTCAARGADSIMKKLENFFRITAGNANDAADIDYCPCTGDCERGPNVVIDKTQVIHDANSATIVEDVQSGAKAVPITKLTFDDISKNDFLGDL